MLNRNKVKNIFRLNIFSLLLLSTKVYASNGGKGSFESGWGYIKYILAFLIVIIITKKATIFLAENYNPNSKNKYIKKVSNTRLDKDLMLYLIEVDNQVYILGKTNNNIQVIDKLDKTLSDIETIKEENYNEEKI